MNDSTTNRRLLPQRAIIVYHNKSEYAHDYYLESRDIKQVNGKSVLLAPVPLASNIMRDIAQSYLKADAAKMEFGGLIAGHLLYGSSKPGMTIVMWYRPAMQRHLNFSAAQQIKGNALVKVPATLYLVINTKLYVYALMTDDRPGIGTKLYNAPFYNIYADGNVCLGTAQVGKVKGRTFEKEAERFERAFYMAEQNGGQQDQCKTPLHLIWTQQIKRKLPFPSKKELVQHKKFKTLGDLIQTLIGKNSNNNE